MTYAVLLYDLRRSLPLLAVVGLAVTGCVLLLPGPLQGGQVNWFQPIGMLAGMLLAIRLLSDTGKTQAYVYSRGITRRRVFLQRIVLGLGLLILLGGLAGLILVLGFRERVHSLLRMRDVIFYPMAAQFEISIVKPLILSSLGTFGIMVFYMTWRGLCNPSWNATSSGMARLAFEEAPLGFLVLWVALFSFGMEFVSGDQEPSLNFNALVAWIPLIASGGGIALSWVAARNLEVG